jgi:hypothetical protein
VDEEEEEAVEDLEEEEEALGLHLSPKSSARRAVVAHN